MRASDRRRGVIGGRKGSGEGKKEGDGRSVKDKGGTPENSKGFVFEEPPDLKPVENGVSKGVYSNVRSGASQLSYRDKLLAPGCAGFLMKHGEADDIMKGWRDYFHHMNEKDASAGMQMPDDEDSQTMCRLEGESGVLKFSADEYTTWCRPWMNSLIIKVLGASFPTYIIRDRINRMWRPKDPLKLIPLSNGYYIVSFSNKKDRDYAFQEGPWMIEYHYLIV
ncbi:hypothetical protein K1719_032007 [Acacia pycnantha]|nr:hypothetical protein K1719_032007 [Acacia pycnantha]